VTIRAQRTGAFGKQCVEMSSLEDVEQRFDDDPDDDNDAYTSAVSRNSTMNLMMMTYCINSANPSPQSRRRSLRLRVHRRKRRLHSLTSICC